MPRQANTSHRHIYSLATESISTILNSTRQRQENRLFAATSVRRSVDISLRRVAEGQRGEVGAWGGTSIPSPIGVDRGVWKGLYIQNLCVWWRWMSLTALWVSASISENHLTEGVDVSTSVPPRDVAPSLRSPGYSHSLWRCHLRCTQHIKRTEGTDIKPFVNR